MFLADVYKLQKKTLNNIFCVALMPGSSQMFCFRLLLYGTT